MTFKVSSRLTLNLGLRYDYTQWPRHRDNKLGSFDLETGKYLWASTNPDHRRSSQHVPYRDSSGQEQLRASGGHGLSIGQQDDRSGWIWLVL